MPSFNIASCRNFDSNNSLLLLSSLILLLLDDCIAVLAVVKYRDCLLLVDNILRRRRVAAVDVRRRFVDLLIVVDIIHAADAIVNVLVNDFGIKASRLTAQGMGEEELLSPANTLQAHEANRRIEAKVRVDKKVAVKR